MKPLPAAILVLVLTSAHADETENAIIAAMTLAENPNYSWTCTISDDAQTYTIQGKTANGYTWQRQPMPATIARRLGRSAEHELEAIFRGPLHYVIEAEDQWKTLEELPKRHRDWNETTPWLYIPNPIVRTPDMPADANDADPLGPLALPPAIYLPVLKQQPEDEVYTNAQFALSLPHEELAIIVSSHEQLHVEGDVAWGTLNDLGAQLLLVHDGHEYIKPVTATGRFKLWLHHGAVVKYQVDLAGILVVRRDPVYVRQTATTVVKDVGVTTVAVPESARRRLAR